MAGLTRHAAKYHKRGASMKTITATFITKDQNWTDGTTVYWFDIEGETFGVLQEGSDSKVVDCDGNPTTEYSASQFTITDDMIFA